MRRHMAFPLRSACQTAACNALHSPERACPCHERGHAVRRITANHAFGPPSLKVKSFRSGRTSTLIGPMDSMLQPSAKAACSSSFDTRSALAPRFLVREAQ